MEENPKTPKKLPTFKEVNKRVTMLVGQSAQYKQKGNIGMSKHLLINACEALLENRDKCSLQEKTQRETMARTLIVKGKTLKI